MVKILSNGEIVPDNDPRAQVGQRQQSASSPYQAQNRRRVHGVVQDETPQQQGQGQQVNIFRVANEKLKEMGIPSFNIGDIVIEPIVTIGLLLAFFMFGVFGLIFGAVLFTVNYWSTNGAPEIVTRLLGGDENRRSNRRPSSRRPPNAGGGGHSLGRS